MPRVRSLAALLAAIVAGAALVTQPLLLRATSHLPFELRDPVFISWVLAWDARHLPHRLLSVWDAPALYPYDATLTFSEHFFGVAVFVAPIVWLTDNPVLAYNGALAGSYVLAGVGLFVLARELSLSTAAACAAAMVYAFGPFRYAQLAHLQNLMTGWMPLVLAGLHAYVMRGSRRGLAGAVVAFLLLSASNLYYMLIFGVLVGPLLIAVLVAAPDRRVALRDLALAAAAFVAIYGPVLKLYADVHERYALARERDLNVRLSADVASYLSQPAEIEAQQGLQLPGFAQPGGPLEVHDGRLFPGFLMIGFAAVGLVAGRGSPVVWVSAAAALTGLLLSLGPSPAIWGHHVGISGPYDALFRFVPGFDGIRVPARFSVLVHLGLAVLAAYGIDRLTHRVGAGRRWWLAGSLGAAAVLLSYPGGTVLAEVGPNGRERDSGLSNWLARQPHGAVLELPIGGFDRNYRGFLYHYRTLRHPHPLVNGWSGYQTDVQLLLGGPA
jgi:hypothetical protein